MGRPASPASRARVYPPLSIVSSTRRLHSRVDYDADGRLHDAHLRRVELLHNFFDGHICEVLRMEHEAVVLIQLREAEARLIVRVKLLRILEEGEEGRDQRVDAGQDANRNLASPSGVAPCGRRKTHECGDGDREKDGREHQ